ncbi:hypothetical protein MKJ04_01130 [Pontibacter sp. E15-1]|uniref:hypothetical protein n=1 Tax=Pontibacter sp. E15-1 TaxID=2919918 RepID=UPI001F4FDE69|nr:hypothetical protein [Pontibacter sp. E15-1]MCJ8163423.1 hypothetical protein [Pontibacter sp. E15-1]
MLELEELEQYPGIHTLYIPTENDVPFSLKDFRRGVDFILLEHHLGKNVLIASGAGISRAVAYALAVLKEEEGLSLLQAYTLTLRQEFKALPHPVIWQSLCKFYGENIPYLEVLRKYNKARN